MTTFPTPVRTFLGTNTAEGFIGYPEDLYEVDGNWRAWLIKSGPGSGKSTLMKRLLTAALEAGYEPEAICCSSDPDSLDGVVIHEKKIAVLDATAPHTLEPKLWSAVERLVDLGACVDGERLHERAAELIAVHRDYAAASERIRRRLRGAGGFATDARQIAEGCLDGGKIAAVAARIARREFPPCRGGEGRERRRFLSALTPQGYLTFGTTAPALCPRIYAIEDDHGAAAGLLLGHLRRAALAAGLEIYTCRCPLEPARVEHLLIPAIGVAFTHSDRLHPVDIPVYRRIHAARFTDEARLRARRQTLRFDQKMTDQLLTAAVEAARDAKAVHDRMETFTADAFDREKADALTARLLAEWLGFPDL